MASHMRTKEELLARATQPTEDALRLHPFYKGKVQVMPKCPIRNLGDFSVWYTPGVAASCRAIKEQPDLVYEHTNKANCIAIVTDGDCATKVIRDGREATRLLTKERYIPQAP